MADISKITLPNNSTYDIKDSEARSKLFYSVNGTQTATTASWTGNIDVDALYNGLTIAYYLPYTSGKNVTLNLTLSDGTTTGAIPVYYTGTSRMTTHYAAGSTIMLTYWGAGSIKINGTATTAARWTSSDYNSNTTVGYGFIDYYFRPYAGSVLYRYKLCLLGEDNRIYPIVTTNQEDTTQVAKVVQTVGLRPGNIWYYNNSSTISAGELIGAQKLNKAMYTTGASYSFNATVPKYRTVYLCGTYNKTKDLFYLYDDGQTATTSYYTTVPTNTANITLSNYFVSGYYYMLVGGTYSSNDYLQLFANNPLYYFDGTNLIPASTKVAMDQAASAGGVTSVNGQNGVVILDYSDVGALPDSTSIPSKTSDLTNDSGFLTSYTETDPTVPSWAKASSKPTYTYSEVGAAASSHSHAISDVTNLQTTLNTKANSSDLATVATSGSYNDLSDKPTIPTIPVSSVNGQTGTVVLDAEDVGALPSSTTIPAQISKIWTGTCSTAKGTAAKVVTLDDATGFSLNNRTIIAVRFNYPDSRENYTAGTNITLNVNNTQDSLVFVLNGDSSVNQISEIIQWGEQDIVFFKYKVAHSGWVFMGSSRSTCITHDLASKAVPSTRTVNSKALSSNITLTASDVGAQATLTFDSTPTNGSSNPVTSDGIYDAIPKYTIVNSLPTTGDDNTIYLVPMENDPTQWTFDSAPTQNSTNPVTSGGVYTALTNISSAFVPEIYTGVCNTSEATAAKVVTLNNSANFSLVDGVKVAVTFTNGNNANYPTLNVNSTGAYDFACPAGLSSYVNNDGTGVNFISQGETILFTYKTNVGWIQTASAAMTWHVVNYKADTYSPEFSGVPTAPTAASGTNTTQIATTAFVQTALDGAKITYGNADLTENVTALAEGTFYAYYI